MKIKYVYHDLFKRINIEKINKGFDINLWKLSIRLEF